MRSPGRPNFVPGRAPADAAPNLQRCRLQGGTLIAWLDRFAPHLLQERAFFSHLDGTEPEPFVIVLSDISGLVAAQEAIGESNGIAFLTNSEFEAFTSNHPDEEHKWHVQFINKIGPAEGEIAARAEREYPLKGGDEHWIHDEASVMGPLFGRGAQHLLKWDGANVSVLKKPSAYGYHEGGAGGYVGSYCCSKTSGEFHFKVSGFASLKFFRFGELFLLGVRYQVVGLRPIDIDQAR